MTLDSTIGKYFVVRNYDIISSYPKIIRHTSFESVYGFINKQKAETFERKHNKCCNLTINQQEVKLHLIDLLRKSIRRICKVLEPYYGFKALVEKSVRILQENCPAFQDFNEIEESDLFEILVLQIGYLGFLKINFIDFEKLFRIRVYCPKHKALAKGQKIKMPCMCLYGMDEVTIKRSFQKGITRKELKADHLKTYFEWNGQLQKYQIQKKFQEEFKSYKTDYFETIDQEKAFEEIFGVPVHC